MFEHLPKASLVKLMPALSRPRSGTGVEGRAANGASAVDRVAPRVGLRGREAVGETSLDEGIYSRGLVQFFLCCGSEIGSGLAVFPSALEPAAQLRDGLESDPAKPVVDLLEDLQGKIKSGPFLTQGGPVGGHGQPRDGPTDPAPSVVSGEAILTKLHHFLP